MARQGIVISNCQCAPLANALTVNCHDTRFDYFGVHVLPPHEREDALTELVRRGRTECDVIIAIPLSEEWGVISAPRLRETFAGKLVIFVSNIYFAGWHPDLTYIGGMAQRVAGPLGEYHSKLALFGFLNNLGIRRTIGLFRDEVYEPAGYYETYARSFSELRHRDQQVEYRVTDIMEDAMRQDLCFFSVNHPTSALFAPFAQLIARGLAERGLCRRAAIPASPFLYENSLVVSSIFPVYPEIARRHGMAQLGSYVFKPDGWQANPLDLPFFVASEFAAFEAAGRDNLAGTPLAAELAAQFSFLL